METIFPMLEVMPIPAKPRRESMLLMSETGIPLRQSEDICEIAAPVIDYAKITDHAGMSSRLSADWLAKKIRLYNSYKTYRSCPAAFRFSSQCSRTR